MIGSSGRTFRTSSSWDFPDLCRRRQRVEDPETGEVFALWIAPTVRGERVGSALVSTAAVKAAEDGCRLLYFWAGSDNASAVGFASSFGFRPTSERRPVPVADGASEKDADEVAMVLPLSPDPTQKPDPYMG